MKIFRNVEDFFFGGGGESGMSSRTCGLLFIKSLPNVAYLITTNIAASTKSRIKFVDVDAVKSILYHIRTKIYGETIS